jgi:hypothetical protein
MNGCSSGRLYRVGQIRFRSHKILAGLNYAFDNYLQHSVPHRVHTTTDLVSNITVCQPTSVMVRFLKNFFATCMFACINTVCISGLSSQVQKIYTLCQGLPSLSDESDFWLSGWHFYCILRKATRKIWPQVSHLSTALYSPPCLLPSFSVHHAQTPSHLMYMSNVCKNWLLFPTARLMQKMQKYNELYTTWWAWGSVVVKALRY